jgi:3-isopropylmalate/(R)-2-methylmalate dehydratase small subunit
VTPFTTLTAPVMVLNRANIDTDQIIPARFLRKPRSVGYGQFLFADLGVTLPQGAAILLAGPNFGCGSSREGAVYALVDAGIRCVIAPSFGDIFSGNAAQNGLLTVALALPGLPAGEVLTVDLPAQAVRLPDGTVQHFEIDPFRKQRLLEGRDDIDLTLAHEAEIAAFEARDRRERPWAATG